MKIFLDTASISEIKEARELGMVDGVTTNPTLLAKEGRQDFEQVVCEICSIVKGPVSVEVISSDSEGIIEEARRLSKLAPNVVVKIPMTEEGLKAMQVLHPAGIKVNMTLVFSVNQALLAAKANVDYVSPFIGRLDDIGHDGMGLVRDILEVYKIYSFKTQVIVASVRHPTHVIEAAKAGAPIATIPFGVLKKMFRHQLTDSGIEHFMSDWKKLNNNGR